MKALKMRVKIREIESITIQHFSGGNIAGGSIGAATHTTSPFRRYETTKNTLVIGKYFFGPIVLQLWIISYLAYGFVTVFTLYLFGENQLARATKVGLIDGLKFKISLKDKRKYQYNRGDYVNLIKRIGILPSVIEVFFARGIPRSRP
jgi:hypothetical protein